MDEYIKREALLKHKTMIPGFIGEYVNIGRITEASPADVVEVVRCKDCKYRADRLYCRLRETPYIVTNVDFCSFGVPRED